MADQESKICSIDSCKREALPDRKRCEHCTLRSRRYYQEMLAPGRSHKYTAERWHAMGLCYTCGAEPRDGEHLQGENCKAKTAELDRRIEEANARKHLEAVEENLPRICSTRRCNREAAPKRKVCEHCRLKNSRKSRAYRKKRQEDGKCQRCSNPRDGDMLTCRACRESHNEALRQSRAKQQAEPKDPWLCTTVWCKREASPDRKLCERCLLASRNQRNRRVAKELELGLRRNCGAEPRDGRTAMGNVLKDLDDGRMTSNAVPEDDQRNHQAPEPLPVAEGSTSNSFSLPLRSRNTFWDVVV